MNTNRALFLLFLLSFTGCFAGAVFTVYRPYSQNYGYGYAEFTIDAQTVEVSFTSSLGENASYLKSLAQLRGAEIGKARQFTHMLVTSSEVKDIPITETTTSSYAPRDTTQNASKDVAKTQKSISGRREVILQIRFCKTECENALEIDAILNSGKESGFFPVKKDEKG